MPLNILVRSSRLTTARRVVSRIFLAAHRMTCMLLRVRPWSLQSGLKGMPSASFTTASTSYDAEHPGLRRAMGSTLTPVSGSRAGQSQHGAFVNSDVVVLLVESLLTTDAVGFRPPRWQTNDKSLAGVLQRQWLAYSAWRSGHDLAQERRS